MKIYVTGDTHQENNSEKLSEENFVEQKELTKDDFVIIVGDFGCYWNEKSKKEIESREKLAEKPFTILYIEGNHDNYDLIENLPESEWNGGRVHIDERYGFIHLMRGQVYNINGNKIFTFGGAYSIDKKFRKQGISHWDRELPSEEEYEEGRIPLYHFDVYRIGDVEEMFELGFEDYFYGKGLTLIEWANLIEEILPAKRKEITIEKNLDLGFDYRKITIKEVG